MGRFAPGGNSVLLEPSRLAGVRVAIVTRLLVIAQNGHLVWVWEPGRRKSVNLLSSISMVYNMVKVIFRTK